MLAAEAEMEDMRSTTTTTRSQVPLLTPSMGSRGKLSSSIILEEQSNSNLLSNRKYFGDSELLEIKEQHQKQHHHHHHHHPTKPPLSTKAKKIELAKKIGRVVYTLFLLTVMGALITLDIVQQPKNAWITRGSIVIAVTLFGRWIYEFFFEIFYEWLLDYFISDEMSKANSEKV